MYTFVDSVEHGSSSSLPAEALQINGRYIENIIDGYRTLYTSGRDLLAPELNTLELTKKHGSIYKSRRYPERSITVGFQLIAPSSEEFRKRFNTLNGILYAEEAQLIFADEPDKCFYGTLSDFSAPEPGRNAVIGEFTFTCSDPFKYSVEEIVAVPSADNGKTIIVDYAGTVEAYPRLEVDFPKHGTNGVCTYLAFSNGNGDIIQIGGADTGSFPGDTSDAANLIYEFFYGNLNAPVYCGDDIYCSDSLLCCLSEDWLTNTGTYRAFDDQITKSGSVEVSEPGINGRLQAASYGTGNGFHGPSVSTVLTNTVSGIVDFELAFRNYLIASAIDEKGLFIATLNHGSGEDESVLASLALVKNEDEMSINILMIINDEIRKQVTLPLPISNTLNRITKEGTKIEFTACGRTYTFYDDSLTDIGAHSVGFLFGAYGTEQPLSVNNLEWVRLTNAPGKFTNNDAIVADCRSAMITMNDVNRPALDTIGNDWESFTLKPGINQIRTSYKISTSKVPDFKVRYREVFL